LLTATFKVIYAHCMMGHLMDFGDSP